MILVYQTGLFLSQNQRYVSFVGRCSKIRNFVSGKNREPVDENHTCLAPFRHQRINLTGFNNLSGLIRALHQGLEPWTL